VGVAMGVAAKAMRKPQTEAVTTKSAQVLPQRPLRNPFN